jgi:hypothetical protein
MQLVTQSNLRVDSFAGIWRCRYWYPSNKHLGEDVSEYEVLIDTQNGEFAVHSLPNTLQAYMQARFSVLSNLATGSWLENTSPHGDFQGLIYSGAFQLIIDEDAKRMAGKWVGIGRGDPSPKIYDGRWEIEYLREK